MNEAKERIRILTEGQVISLKTGKYVCQVIDYLEASDLKTDQDKLNTMLTHLAMATQRLLEGKEAEMPDEAVWKEVEEDSCYQEAEKLVKTIENLSFLTYPESERRYLLIHICNMLH